MTIPVPSKYIYREGVHRIRWERRYEATLLKAPTCFAEVLDCRFSVFGCQQALLNPSQQFRTARIMAFPIGPEFLAGESRFDRGYIEQSCLLVVDDGLFLDKWMIANIEDERRVTDVSSES